MTNTEPEGYRADLAYRDAINLLANDRPAEAENIFRQLLEIQPSDPDVNYRMACAVGEQRRTFEAIKFAKRAIAGDQQRGPFWSVYGALVAETGDYKEGLRACNRALELSPDMPAAHWNRCGCAIWEGDWTTGWGDYEWGFINRSRRLRTLSPMWDCKTPVNKLFVSCEQGNGDIIQMAGLIGRIKPLVNHLIWEVQDPLVRLAENFTGVDEVVCLIEDWSVPQFDAWVSIMSLPKILGLGAPPVYEPYVKADPDLVEKWSTRLPEGKKVAVCWKGNPTYAQDGARSIHNETLLAPLGNINASLVSFQKGCDDKELPFECLRLGEEFRDWADTAAALESVDFLVTTCTGIAHLAGAMGKQVCLLMQKAGDWRFGPGPVSWWYPTMTIFTQPDFGDWESVCKQVSEYINDRLK